MKYTRGVIVEERSAAPMMMGDVERAGISTDHRGMVRFVDSDDAGFKMVVAAIRRYAEAAPKVVADRHLHAEEEAERARMAEARELLGVYSYEAPC